MSERQPISTGRKVGAAILFTVGVALATPGLIILWFMWRVFAKN